MSKKMNSDDKLRGVYKGYLVKVLSSRPEGLVDAETALTIFDLALQKSKLTSLEDELAKGLHPVEKSKIDVSGGVCEVCEVECQRRLNIAVQALTLIASYDEGDTIGAEFDEPHAAGKARIALAEIVSK